MFAESNNNSDFAESDPEIIFTRLPKLPSLPALLIEALQQLDDHQNISMLIDKIGRDPPLVARLLRIANSSFYGMSREIASLREAIVVLGYERVRDLLIGTCFSQMFTVQHNDFDYTKFWRHSMAVADCSRQLANYSGISQDIAFTAGLLHDIGHLIIAFLFSDAADYVFKTPNTHLPSGTQMPATKKQRSFLCFEHADIGAKAALYWNFPVSIQNAIKQHEAAPEPGAVKSLALLIYTANLLEEENMPWDEPAALDKPEALRFALDVLKVPMDQALLSADAGRQFAEHIVATL